MLLNVMNLNRFARICRHISTSPSVNYAMPLKMPALSPTMAQGNIVKWYKNEGDVVKPGDILCDIETDKAIMAFENEEDGILAKIVKPDATKDVEIGTIIAMLADEDEDWQNVVVPADSKPQASEASAPPPAAAAAQSQPVIPSSSSGRADVKMGPASRLLVQLYQLQASNLTHLTKNGRLLKHDLLDYINRENLSPKEQVPHLAEKSAAPSTSKPKKEKSKPSQAKTREAAATFIDVNLSETQMATAQLLAQSKQTVPHFYTSSSCSITHLQQICSGNGLTVNDFVLSAVAQSLTRFPTLNSGRVDAVDLCLLLPEIASKAVIPNANLLSLQQLNQVVENVKNGAVAQQQGGSFTISILSEYGVGAVKEIIHPPQTGILAIGAPASSWRLQKSAPVQDQVLQLGLSTDASRVDPTEAAGFLRMVRGLLQQPTLMLTVEEDGSQEEVWESVSVKLKGVVAGKSEQSSQPSNLRVLSAEAADVLGIGLDD